MKPRRIGTYLPVETQVHADWLGDNLHSSVRHFTTRGVLWCMLTRCDRYPVYSFFLPIYSFWSMGEFSWGNNHLVENEGGKTVMITSFHRMKLRETSISQRNILRKRAYARAWRVGSLFVPRACRSISNPLARSKLYVQPG
jgi:hypothetical protein